MTITERLVTYNDKTQNLAQWCRETGIPRKTLTRRLNDNWPMEQVFQKPIERKPRAEYESGSGRKIKEGVLKWVMESIDEHPEEVKRQINHLVKTDIVKLLKDLGPLLPKDAIEKVVNTDKKAIPTIIFNQTIGTDETRQLTLEAHGA